MAMLDIAEHLGLGVALKLMQHYGGQEVYFRQQPAPDLVELLGEEAARAVCDLLGGERLYVPHGRATRRRQEVEALSARGHDRRHIARSLGISQRHVRRLANAPPDALPLFPDEE